MAPVSDPLEGCECDRTFRTQQRAWASSTNPVRGSTPDKQEVLTTKSADLVYWSMFHIPVPTRFLLDCWKTERWTDLRSAKWLLRKEVIQPHLPVRLPCYDLVLIASPTFDGSLHKGWATGFGCYRLS